VAAQAPGEELVSHEAGAFQRIAHAIQIGVIHLEFLRRGHQAVPVPNHAQGVCHGLGPSRHAGIVRFGGQSSHLARDLVRDPLRCLLGARGRPQLGHLEVGELAESGVLDVLLAEVTEDRGHDLQRIAQRAPPQQDIHLAVNPA